jgi:hypothetical protein
MLCYIFYKIITAESLYKAAKLFIPTLAFILFWYRAFKLNNFRRKKDNLEELNFFEYYEEALEIVMKFRTIDVNIFFPIFKKEQTKTLDRIRLRLNFFILIVYALFICLICL